MTISDDVVTEITKHTRKARASPVLFTFKVSFHSLSTTKWETIRVEATTPGQALDKALKSMGLSDATQYHVLFEGKAPPPTTSQHRKEAS